MRNNTLSRAELTVSGNTLNIHYGDVLIKYHDTLNCQTEIIPYINMQSEIKRNDDYLKDGDVIIADTAEDDTVGKATEIYEVGTKLAVSGLHTIPCRTKYRFAPHFLGFYLNSPSYHNQLYPIMQGIKVTSISKSNISTTYIRHPSVKEQNKIAEMLSLIDKKIELQKKYIEVLKSYKRGLLSTIIKRYSIGRKLSEIADYRSSANTLSMIEEKNQGLYPVYDANGICGYSHTCDITTNYIAIIKDGSGVGRLQSCKGMSSTIGTLGAIIPVNCSAEYLYAALSLVDFKPFITGMAIPHIYFKDYSKIEIPFPNGKIRSDIAALSTLFDEHILASINVMNELTKQKHSLFQELFI